MVWSDMPVVSCHWVVALKSPAHSVSPVVWDSRARSSRARSRGTLGEVTRGWGKLLSMSKATPCLLVACDGWSVYPAWLDRVVSSVSVVGEHLNSCRAMSWGRLLCSGSARSRRNSRSGAWAPRMLKERMEK